MKDSFYTNLYNDLYDNHNYIAGTKFKAPLYSLSKVLPLFPPKWTFLDLGCSRGMFLKSVKELYTSNCILHGIDISQKAILDANKIPGISCLQGNITNTPYDDEFFDVVHTSNVLEHLIPDDRHIGVREAYRILKPNGIFFGDTSTTYESSTGTWGGILKEKYNIEDLHMDPITAEEWLEIFEASGFIVLWHDIYTRQDCRCESRGFTTGIGQCHVKFTCKKKTNT